MKKDYNQKKWIEKVIANKGEKRKKNKKAKGKKERSKGTHTHTTPHTTSNRQEIEKRREKNVNKVVLLPRAEPVTYPRVQRPRFSSNHPKVRLYS